MPPPLPIAGKPISAAPIAWLQRGMSALSRWGVGPGLTAQAGGPNPTIGRAPDGEFDAKLSGAGPTYTFAEQRRDTLTSWAAISGGRTGDVLEANGITGLADKVARIKPDGVGGYYLIWNAVGNSPPCPGTTLTVKVHGACAGMDAYAGTVHIVLKDHTGATIDTGDATVATPYVFTFDEGVGSSTYTIVCTIDPCDTVLTIPITMFCKSPRVVDVYVCTTKITIHAQKCGGGDLAMPDTYVLPTLYGGLYEGPIDHGVQFVGPAWNSSVAYDMGVVGTYDAADSDLAAGKVVFLLCYLATSPYYLGSCDTTPVRVRVFPVDVLTTDPFGGYVSGEYLSGCQEFSMDCSVWDATFEVPCFKFSTDYVYIGPICDTLCDGSVVDHCNAYHREVLPKRLFATFNSGPTTINHKKGAIGLIHGTPCPSGIFDMGAGTMTDFSWDVFGSNEGVPIQMDWDAVNRRWDSGVLGSDGTYEFCPTLWQSWFYHGQYWNFTRPIMHIRVRMSTGFVVTYERWADVSWESLENEDECPSCWNCDTFLATNPEQILNTRDNDNPPFDDPAEPGDETPDAVGYPAGGFGGGVDPGFTIFGIRYCVPFDATGAIYGGGATIEVTQ